MPRFPKLPVAGVKITVIGVLAGVLTLASSCNGVAGLAGPALAAQQPRVALQSQCAQNVIECTTVWPIPVVTLTAGDDQQVSITNTGFLVEGTNGDGTELVQLVGSGSRLGDNATSLTFSWTSAAQDSDPCSLAPGTVFSTQPDPQVRLAAGFHYIRLTVTNDNVVDVESADCGLSMQAVNPSDFIEVEIEVRD